MKRLKKLRKLFPCYDEDNFSGYMVKLAIVGGIISWIIISAVTFLYRPSPELKLINLLWPILPISLTTGAFVGMVIAYGTAVGDAMADAHITRCRQKNKRKCTKEVI